MTDHPHAKLLAEARSHGSEPPIYAYVTDDKLEGMFDNELRHSSGKKPYDYLKGWLSMLRPFAYATQDDSWGEMEKLLMIVMRNYVRRTRLLTRLAAALEAAPPTSASLVEEKWHDIVIGLIGYGRYIDSPRCLTLTYGTEEEALAAHEAITVADAALETAQPSPPSLAEALARADWPITGSFRFYDEPGEHDPCYVIMPDGAMLAFNHHAGEGVDIARAKFVMNACNAALTAHPAADAPTSDDETPCC